MESIFAHYARKERSRNNIYFAERDNFFSHIPSGEELKHLVGKRKEPVVSVCGRSKTGKTTLILKLMGATDEGVQLLRKALRGNTVLRSGEGGTPTAITYGWSDDDMFHLHSKQGKVQKVKYAEDVEKWLQDIRNKMKRSEIEAHANQWYQIEIPKNGYAGDNPRSLKVIDTPGSGVENTAENRHLDQICRSIVASSSMIIYVEQADAIAHLKNRSIPGLGLLMEVGTRFSLVITRVFSSYSTKDSNNKDFFSGNYNCEEIREWMSNRLKDSGFECSLEKLYPIEYGDSWETQKIKEQQKVKALEPIIADLVNDLYGQIKSALEPDQVIRQFLAVEHDISRHYEQRISKFINQQKELTLKAKLLVKEMKLFRLKIRRVEGEITNNEQKIRYLKRKFHAIDKMIERSASFPKLILPKGGESDTPSEEFTTTLTIYRNELAKYPNEQLAPRIERIHESLKKFGIIISWPDFSSDHLKKCMIKPTEWKNNCTLEGPDWDYHWNIPIKSLRKQLSQVFFERRKKAKDNATSMLRECKHAVINFIKIVFDVEVKKLEAKSRSTDRLIFKLNEDINSKRSRLSELKELLSSIKEQHNICCQDESKCADQASAVPQRLVDAFSKDYKKRISNLTSLSIHEMIAERVALYNMSVRLRGHLLAK